MFQDVAEFLEDELHLPIKGKVYDIPPVDALTGLRYQRLLLLARLVAVGEQLTDDDLAELRLDDKNQEALYRRLLTDAVFDQMIADGVSWKHLERAGNTAVAFFVEGEDAAQAVWNEAPGKAKTPPKQPQDRKRPRKTAASRSGSTTTQ